MLLNPASFQMENPVVMVRSVAVVRQLLLLIAFAMWMVDGTVLILFLSAQTPFVENVQMSSHMKMIHATLLTARFVSMVKSAAAVKHIPQMLPIVILMEDGSLLLLILASIQTVVSAQTKFQVMMIPASSLMGNPALTKKLLAAVERPIMVSVVNVMTIAVGSALTFITLWSPAWTHHVNSVLTHNRYLEESVCCQPAKSASMNHTPAAVQP